MPRGKKSAAVDLHSESIGAAGSPPLVILHGLFGSLDNWRPEGKALSHYFFVHLLDLRNHGASAHSNSFDYDLISQDLLQFLDKRKVDSAHLIGHSLGGKIAMRFAAVHPERVRKLVMVDIAPKPYPGLNANVFSGLTSVNPAQYASRSEVGQALAAYVTDDVVRHFLLKSLMRDDSGKLRWKLNVAGLAAHEAEINGWENKGKPFAGPALFLRGGKSDYILPEDEPSIRKWFPRAEFATIVGAGHWPHADAPAEFLKVVLDFLRG